MVYVKELKIVMSGNVSRLDVVYAAVEAAVHMWRQNRNLLQSAFNAQSMKRAGLVRIN
jgi:hypothetical protein